MPWYSFSNTQHGGSTYHLRRYLVRSILTLLGPIVILGFYVYICIFYLKSPPQNNFVSDNVNGNWIFYAWFVLSVLIIDWARTGLANIEASALMDSRIAPLAAATLMWHTDANWSNPLWWFKAILSFVPRGIPKTASGKGIVQSRPGGLWISLSLTMVFLIGAIPLSGLSIQTAQVLTGSSRKALIYGPQQTSLGSGGTQGNSVRVAWQSGRRTSPQGEGIMYAPLQSKDVSEFYFDDMAAEHVTVIETFIGPAVRESVVGRVWGIWSNISCQPVAPEKLELIQSSKYDNFSINFCATQQANSCDFQWIDTANASQRDTDATDIVLPLWLLEAGQHGEDLINYSIVAATDGFVRRPGFLPAFRASHLKSPYFTENNHDNVTVDSLRNGASNDLTTAVFEVYIWQSRQGPDTLVQSWIDNASDTVSILYEPNGYLGLSGERGDKPWVGFGIHCDVKSATGFANLNPGRRQFSNFTLSPAVFVADAPGSGIGPLTTASFPSVWPIQITALWSMSAMESTATKKLREQDPNSDQSVWAVIQQSINSRNFILNFTSSKSKYSTSVRPLISPFDLQRSIYKLLGESLIMLMEETNNLPWSGDLYELRTATYIVAGPVPWQYVLAFLALWTLLTSGGALWMIASGRRWAPTLNGFEMFKFGAQYRSEMNELTDLDFTKCLAPLDRIPGMVGLLHGRRTRSMTNVTQMHSSGQGYFIGLSENPIGSGLRDATTTFTFDRDKASVTRY